MSVKCKDYDQLIKMFMKSIANFNSNYPELMSVKKYVFIESNGRYDGGAFVSAYKSLRTSWFKRVGRLNFAGEGQKYGINKTRSNSLYYIKETAVALALGQINFEKSFAQKKLSKEPISKLRNQMEIFPIVKNEEYKKLKAIGSIQDDLLISLMMCIFWYKEGLINSKLFDKWNNL